MNSRNSRTTALVKKKPPTHTAKANGDSTSPAIANRRP